MARVNRATRLALVVGPILVLINQGDTITAGHQPNWLKVALTFAVPYCVSTGPACSKILNTFPTATTTITATDHETTTRVDVY